MPVQEALVLSLADLATPSGVSFQPPCKTREEDAAAWQQVLPGLTAQWNQGREIMALIQTRNTRQWSASARNYVYKPSEDYLIAAYSVAPSLGRPYTPGLLRQALGSERRRCADQRGRRPRHDRHVPGLPVLTGGLQVVIHRRNETDEVPPEERRVRGSGRLHRHRRDHGHREIRLEGNVPEGGPMGRRNAEPQPPAESGAVLARHEMVVGRARSY